MGAGWVRVMAEYSSDGLWSRDGLMMSRADLPVSRALRERHAEGCLWYEQSEFFVGPEQRTADFDVEAFAAEGLAIARAIALAGIEASVSHSAGTFVCNHVFYGLMQTLKRRPRGRGGFIHVPFLPEQSERQGRNAPSMPLPQMVRGVEIAIETALVTPPETLIAGGATH